jgi:hypothetical protein
MKKQIRAFWTILSQMSRSKWVIILISAFILFVVLSFLLPYLEIFPLIITKQAVPLHYNIHFGVDSFGPWWRVFTPTIVGVITFIVNILFSGIYWNRDRMLSYSILAIMPVLGVFILLSSIFITLLNLSYD